MFGEVFNSPNWVVKREVFMTQQSISIPAEVNDLAEGSPSSYEIAEPANRLKTSLLPAIDSTTYNKDATSEAEKTANVNVKVEGEDDGDEQDASLTVDEAKKVPSSEKSPSATGEKSPQILIVEDTTELAEVIQATLERMNMTTYHETHGTKAIDLLKKISPDVVLLDISLPDMTGWKILDVIKEKQLENKKKSPVVIIITAYGDPANRLVGKLQGVHSYLIKPFTSDEIEKIVAQALSSSAS